MQRKPSLNLLAFIVAVLVTLAAALFTAWWYGLDWNVVYKFAPLYVGMFVMAVGVPVYYTFRLRTSRRGIRG